MSEINENFQFDGIIRDIEKKLIKLLIEIGKDSPLSSKLTEILGYLLFHGQLTQAQLAKLTGFSLGTISSYLNQMISLKIVQKELIPKTRTYKYTFLGGKGSIEMQASYMKLDTISNSISFFKEKIAELMKMQTEEGCDILLERLKTMLKYFKWHKKILIEKYKNLGVNRDYD